MDDSQPSQLNMQNDELKRHQLKLQNDNTIPTDILVKDIKRRKEEEEAPQVDGNDVSPATFSPFDLHSHSHAHEESE